MTVFIVCEPAKTLDFTPALEYGKLEVLLAHSQSMLAPVQTVRQLRQKLANFTDEDFIIPTGDPVLISTVSSVATHINHGRAKFLKWDKLQRKYYQIQIDVSGRSL